MPFAAALSTALEITQAMNEVCGQVVEQLGQPVELAIVFYSPHHMNEAAEIAKTLMAKLQPRHLIGCLGESLIANHREIEQHPALVLWAASWEGKVAFESFQLTLERTPDGPTLLGWPDSLLEADPRQSLMLTLGDPYSFPVVELFLPRMNEDYPGIAVVGGMSSNPHGPGMNPLIRNDEVIVQGAVGVLLQGDFAFRSVVSQGARPIGRPLVITRGNENIILELSGQPPLVYLRELYQQLPEVDRQLFERGLMIGIAMSEYRDRFAQGDFVIRNLQGSDTESGAIAIADWIRVGQTVQFQLRDAASADADLNQLLQSLTASGFTTKGGLLFSCNGRGSRMFSQPNHDATAIRDQLGSIPLAGFFAAGELGPVGGKNFIHGFTASALLFG